MPDAPETTGINHVTNVCTGMGETRSFYEDVLGFHTVKRTENYDDPGAPHFYVSPTPEGEPGTVISYFEYPDGRGTSGPDASHQFAMGVGDGETLREWRDHLRVEGVRVSDVRDRTYFESIYLSDPDGLTIEICTDGPSFGVDEDEPGSTFIEAPEEKTRQGGTASTDRDGVPGRSPRVAGRRRGSPRRYLAVRAEPRRRMRQHTWTASRDAVTSSASRHARDDQLTDAVRPGVIAG